MQTTILKNPRHGTPGLVTLPTTGFRRAKAEITAWPHYAPTPLHDLPGAITIRLKDEALRFGLHSFKSLGGAYAVQNLLANALSKQNIRVTSQDLESGKHQNETRKITITSATDGNHGRAVAWACQRFHCPCVIYIHETVSAARATAIAAFGARIVRTKGTYDDAVKTCATDAATQNRFIVSDTSWPGYQEVPRDIMQGYRVMPDEAADQWTGPPPTHVFIQAGVGGAAAAVSAQSRLRWPGPDTPRLIVVEPNNAACLLASAQKGQLTPVEGGLDTIMAGLACGEPSMLAWQELERAAWAFMAIPDDAVIETMRKLAARDIVSGESGSAGLAACDLALADPTARETLGLGTNSRVLAFNTEGATDPHLYATLIA